MSLFVLDPTPVLAAKNAADIHLVPLMLNIARVISTAVQELGETKKEVKEGGVRVYRTKIGEHLVETLTPIRNPKSDLRPWVDWVKKEYGRFWWMIQYAWMCDKERIQRFNLEPNQNHEIYLILQNLVQKGAADLFPKDKSLVGNWLFPITTSKAIACRDTPIETYRAAYREYRKNPVYGIKLKWTRAEEPAWLNQVVTTPRLLPVPVNSCQVCSNSNVDPRMCDFSGCPGKAGLLLKGI